jgi:mannosylglycoprotein endo-beta-mannosidase
MKTRKYIYWLLALLCYLPAFTQSPVKIQRLEAGEKTCLHEGWFARNASEIGEDGNRLTGQPFEATGWMKAKVPGTVLTTLLENKLYPAPEFGLNNQLIPDIFHVGRAFYTYWFACPFTMEALLPGQHAWLNFRGINYKAEIYLNGKRVNTVTHEGMFLRQSYDITSYLKENGTNVLAVLVFPPDHVGNPNGGQGGDGQIARNCTMQYTPGWDWIQPVRDRNTGIWDEVSMAVTKDVRVQHPYVVTKVPRVRIPSASKQEPAYLETSVELENVSDQIQKGTAVATYKGKELRVQVSLEPGEKKHVSFPKETIRNPKLWWPNGIGQQPLEEIHFSFIEQTTQQVSDQQSVRFGIREIQTRKNEQNGGREFYVNGQRIYITGGNYIDSDWLLRLSPERYDHEVRFHAEMNLRMIRVWGGALLERPEFYQACDKYGILVFQDLWGSGDCNGAWEDLTKLDSRERRWEYPDNHALFLQMAEDQIKMIRNHPSLCFWCGANEWPLAKDINEALKNDILPRLDPNRLFASYSTDSVFTRNYLGDNGDGPYGIQEPEWFFTFRSHPFNPEAGSVGSPEVESFRAFMPEEDLKAFPRKSRTRNPNWIYHKDLGYGDHLERYGELQTIEDYCRYAQLVNYDQYRSFMEGWASHMWDWYTGILIWKTQNPWTALRGQMYDWYLDVNASLYGTKKGCEPLHPFYNLVTKQVQLLNTTVEAVSNLTVKAEIFNREGKKLWEQSAQANAEASQVKDIFAVPVPSEVSGVYFLKLSLWDGQETELTRNIYWLTTTPKDYRTLHELPKSSPDIKTTFTKDGNTYTGKTVFTADAHISFFNRIKLFDKQTGKRILPVHYSDNYITLMPGDQQTVTFSFQSELPESQIEVVVEGFNK